LLAAADGGKMEQSRRECRPCSAAPSH